jgi:hypothetical protein
LICSVTVVLWFAVADVPLKVKVCVPVPAFWVTVIVAVAVAGSVPSRETEDGEIAQDVPPGRPLQESEMLPVRPPSGVIVIV